MKNRIVKGMITFVLAACLFTSSIPALAEEISVPVEAEVVDEEPSSAENMPVVKQETEEVAAEENVGEESEVATEIVVLEVEEDETVAEALNNDIVAEGIVAQLEAELSVASEELEQATELMLLAEDTGENEAQKILVPETDYIEMSQQTTGTAVFKIANKYVNNATIKTMTDSTTVMAWCMKVVGGNAKVEDVFYFEHSYVDGICEVCGDTQPDYVVPNADPQIGEKQIGIRVPEGFAVEFGYQQSYKHNYIGEVKVQNNVWVFDAASSKIYFYRVYSVESNNDAVTYWGWLYEYCYSSEGRPGHPQDHL